MIGTLVNAGAIVAGGGAGLLARDKLGARYHAILMQSVGLVALLIGLQMALQARNPVVVLASMILGAVLGEFGDIEGRLEALGRRLQRWAPAGESASRFTLAFVTATLWFCVGSMAIIGSIEDGLHGNPSILYAKAALDGISSVAAAASLGSGVLFSAVPILLYQGAITLAAQRLGAGADARMIAGLSATGGLLIFAIGLNVLGLTKIRLGNLLPAIFIAALLSRWF